MTQITEATFDGGVLRPNGKLALKQSERVRVIVQSLDGPGSEARRQAMERLRAGIAKMGFRSTGPYPTRDELHERR
jgi:predicted DNA-binding antitoxin AbrB/MazE fold protein